MRARTVYEEPGRVVDSGAESLSPPWPLLCLNTYLQQRTRHAPNLIDARFFSQLESDIAAYVQRLPPADLAVIEATTEGLGQVMQILDVLQRSFPGMATALFGQHAAQFPDQALRLPRVDYVLAGDPEPILHGLLDHFDNAVRLKRIPGLFLRGAENKKPAWLSDLNGLSLPEGPAFYWNAYAGLPGSGGCRLDVRLTRGHTRSPADRAAGGEYEPFRAWRPERLAGCLQKTLDKGVAEFFMTDPPGVWTPERIEDWCVALIRARNSIPWGLRLAPSLLKEDTVGLMARAICRSVVFLFPSCEAEVLNRFGCALLPTEMDGTHGLLRNYGIEPHTELWAGGPEESPGEVKRLHKVMAHWKYRHFTLALFPCLADAPLYRERHGTGAPNPEEWARWACNPWNHAMPVAAWGGASAAEQWDLAFTRLLRDAQRTPGRVLKDLFHRLRGVSSLRGPWSAEPKPGLPPVGPS